MFETTDSTADSPAAGGASFEEELAGLAGGRRAWAGQDLSLLPVVAVPRRVEILLRLRNEVDGELLRELLACDRSGEAARLGGGSTVGWLADAGRLDHRHASSLVRTARGLADRLPATATALSSGDITFEHARLLNRAVTRARVTLAQSNYAGGMAQAEDDLLTVAILANPETTHPGSRQFRPCSAGPEPSVWFARRCERGLVTPDCGVEGSASAFVLTRRKCSSVRPVLPRGILWATNG